MHVKVKRLSHEIALKTANNQSIESHGDGWARAAKSGLILMTHN